MVETLTALFSVVRVLFRAHTKLLPMMYGNGPGGRFSKAPETFRARKAIAKSRTLRLQSCFIHIL